MVKAKSTTKKKAAKGKPAAKRKAPPKKRPAEKVPPAPADRGGYEEYRDRQAGISRDRSASGREIGPLPGVVNPDRRNRGLDSLLRFALDYFPQRFRLPFCGAHHKAIDRLERCTNEGGLFALAFQRGGGKTTLAEVAVLRAVLCGLRRFVVLIQATEKLAQRSLKKLQRELEANDLLLADFPEVCYPIRRLERINHRARGQILGGEHTLMEWTGDAVVLPTVKGSAASGAVIHVAGLTGAIRGLSYPGPAGELLRPDLVILDDCQTRESAKSPTQTADREAVITDDVLGLAGPETTIAAVHLCTPIYVGDLAERFLDPTKHPEWDGLRTKMMEKFPVRMDLWDEYAEVRRTEGAKAATAVYQSRRAEMDAGAVVAWPERTKAGPVEASTAVELAMILYHTNPRALAAEYNCEPEAAELEAGAKELKPDEVTARLNGCERFRVPRECTRLTAFFDVGVYLHWYAVVGWNERFGGGVVDYGCWPRQARSVFAGQDARPKLAEAYPNRTETQVIYAGLKDLVPAVLGRTYLREGGAELRVGRGLIDAGKAPDAVYQFIRQSPFGPVLLASKGVGRSKTSRGVGRWKVRREEGERGGHHWRLTAGDGGKGQQVQFDPDAWKSVIHERLTVPMGGPEALAFYGKEAGAHALIGEHLAAEYAEPVTTNGDTYDGWRARPDRRDNHWLDCLTGCAVAASVDGLRLSAAEEPHPPTAPRPKVKLSDLRAKKAAAGR